MSDDKNGAGEGVETEEFDIREIYTPLSVAKEEIWRRWNDKVLRKKVEDFLGGDIPEVFKDGPKAIIFRNIASPNLEMKIAYDHAQILGLDLVVVEHTHDHFCTRNSDKLYLGKMVFFNKNDKSKIVSKKKLIAIKEDDNKLFADINTLWGENLVDFHHKIFKDNGYKNVRIFDASIYKNMGLSPLEIYLKIMVFAVFYAVLLENFIVKINQGEKKFIDQVIYPAFIEIQEKFNFKPRIVPLIGIEEDGIVYRQYYDEEIIKNLN